MEKLGLITLNLKKFYYVLIKKKDQLVYYIPLLHRTQLVHGLPGCIADVTCRAAGTLTVEALENSLILSILYI